MYTTTINQNGMILLNKAVRESLNLQLGDRVTISFNKKSATVQKEITDEEFFAKLDAMKSERTKKRIKENAGKSADELFRFAMAKSASSKEAA
jgi:bifunctional DNA-binding transcriptional regulator/antitoxin component of YhaV-PrlF toxin-antitoxin module